MTDGDTPLYAVNWAYQPAPRDSGRGVHHLVIGCTHDGRNITLAEIERDHDRDLAPHMPDEDAARIARLMAAAPDLLTACRALRAAVMYRDDPRLCAWVDGVIAQAAGEAS